MCSVLRRVADKACLFDQSLRGARDFSLAVGLLELPLLVQQVLVDLEVGQDGVLRLEDLHGRVSAGGGRDKEYCTVQ